MEPDPILWEYDVLLTNILWELTGSQGAPSPNCVVKRITWWSDDISTIEQSIHFTLSNSTDHKLISFDHQILRKKAT